MKCHWCSKELELQRPDYNDPPNFQRWECPDVHLLVEVTAGAISAYTMFWFEEERGVKNKLISTQTQTILYIARKGEAEGASYTGYRKALDIPQFISLVMEGDQVAYNNVINRLQKLVMFS